MNTSTFIESQLPPALLARLPKLFLEAHILCREVLSSTPWLRVLSLQKGDLRNAAVDFIVSEHLAVANYEGVSHSFPEYGIFTTRNGNKSKATGNFFQIETRESILTISHVKTRHDLPRKARLREIWVDGNQYFFFPEWEHERQEKIKAKEQYAGKRQLLMTYGDQNMEFLQIGAMHPTERQWIEKPLDLLNRPFLAVDNDDHDMEAKNASIPMGVKDQFLQRLSQNAAAE